MANSATAGAAGEVQAARFEDDVVELLQNTKVTGELSVGDGTASVYTLDVRQTSTSAMGSVFPAIRALNKSTATHSFAALRAMGNNGSTDGGFITDGLGTGGTMGTAGSYCGTISNHPFVLAQANTEAVRIDTSRNMGVGTSTIAGQFHVDQSSATGAEPVLYLDQGDVSEEMMELATTIGTGNAIEAIAAKALTTTHFIKVTIPGGLTRYIPCGTIA